MLNKERIVEELVKGHDYATQLKLLLDRSYGVEDFLISSYDDLVLNVLKSFTEALSLLSTSASESVEVCQNLAISQVDSVCWDDRRSEDSGRSRKKPPITPKHRRGCYKRKKSSNSWTKVSPTIEDGHAWRKYGQKEILNTKYPRSYFRCTHKYAQGCRATKQVQRKEDDPNMYLITYIGNHTCSDFLIPTDSNPHWEFSLCAPTVKEETPSDLTDNLSSLDSIIWNNFVAFDEAAAEPPIASSTMEAISHSLDMELVPKSISFDQFDETEFNYIS